MGVRGLQTFIEKDCPGAVSRVRISDIAMQFRTQTGRQPVIVVDGNSCLRGLYGNLDWVHGGQFRLYEHKLREFIQFFVDLDIALVVFFDGPTVERKRPRWCERREAGINDVNELYQLLERRVPINKIPERLVQMPAGAGLMFRLLFSAHKHCTVITTVQECDEEIAYFAKKNQCFAILGQDTDYLIFEGAHIYLSIKHFDIRNGTTILYNRFELTRALRIGLHTLPLFASLIGNDVISRDALADFHRRECRCVRNVEIIRMVAHYVRQFRNEEEILQSLQRIAYDVFRDPSMAELLEDSLRSYQPTLDDDISPDVQRDSWTKLVLHTRKLMQNNLIPAAVYSVMSQNIYEMSSCMEDRQCSFPAIAEVFYELRRRVYGILLHESNTLVRCVDEYCSNKNNQLVRADRVFPVNCPQHLHPGLMNLWDRSCPDYEKHRFMLFVWVLTDDTHMDIKDLINLPAQYLLLVAVCRYLSQFEPSFLMYWEISSLMIQAIKLQSMTLDMLCSLQVPVTDLRCLNLTAMFMRGIQHLVFAAGAVGLPLREDELSPAAYFDGPLFHITYLQSKNGVAPEVQLQQNQEALTLYAAMEKLVFQRCRSSDVDL